MSLFVISIGNTNTRYGIFSNKKFQKINICPTSEFDFLIIPPNMPVAAATVVPEIKKAFPEKNVFWLGAENIKTGLDLSRIDCSTLGADRLANAISLANFAKLPGIVIDAGTAVSIVAVDDRRVLRGGAIFPGRKMLRMALTERTAQLPYIPVQNGNIKALGENTAEAVRSGTDLGMIGAIKEIIKRIEVEMDCGGCYLTAVGGDADFLSSAIPEICRGAEDFTLRGLVIAWELNR